MKEIFSSWTHKTEHFQKIQRKTGIPYKSMLFFDDEDRNIKTVIICSRCKHFIVQLLSKMSNIFAVTSHYVIFTILYSACAVIILMCHVGMVDRKTKFWISNHMDILLEAVYILTC
jgi:hypothetical protein